VFFGTTPALNVSILSDTTITATAPPGTGITDVTVITPFGTSLLTPADEYTYVSTPAIPLPPRHFVGTIKTCFCPEEKYILRAKWHPSPSFTVVLYRIYKDNKMIREVLAYKPLTIKICSHNKHAFKKYEIVAVDLNNVESARVPIKI
jgi:hypothetical protein